MSSNIWSRQLQHFVDDENTSDKKTGKHNGIISNQQLK